MSKASHPKFQLGRSTKTSRAETLAPRRLNPFPNVWSVLRPDGSFSCIHTPSLFPFFDSPKQFSVQKSPLGREGACSGSALREQRKQGRVQYEHAESRPWALSRSSICFFPFSVLLATPLSVKALTLASLSFCDNDHHQPAQTQTQLLRLTVTRCP